MKQALTNYQNSKKITSLIENRTIYSSEYSELSIFETSQKSEKVSLVFDNPIIAGMISGKKIMHFQEMDSFDFLPGELLIIPEKKELIIDFPTATLENPTQCMTLEIEPEKIKKVNSRFIEKITFDDKLAVNFDNSTAYLQNENEVNILLERLVSTFAGEHKAKDILIDLMIDELIIRLLQTKAKYIIFNSYNNLLSDSRIANVVKYIKEHLTEKNISVDSLAEIACLSTSHFFKQFKNTLGISPVDYINSERVNFAKKLLAENNRQISDVAYMSGFNNVSYFNRIFKKYEQMSPSSYAKAIKKYSI